MRAAAWRAFDKMIEFERHRAGPVVVAVVVVSVVVIDVGVGAWVGVGAEGRSPDQD